MITEQPGFHAKTTNRDFRTDSGVHVDARRYGSREMTEYVTWRKKPRVSYD